jgi:hypothetical protein
VPALQLVQAAADMLPVFELYVPEGQEVQSATPPTEYVPVLQVPLHAAVVAPAVPHVPALQFEQVPEPLRAYVPALQATQAAIEVLPEDGFDFPATHAVHVTPVV